MEKTVAVIGGGISGLTIARILNRKYVVKVFEKESEPGGLIKCKRVEGNLYHIVGGHVFNSKRQDVLDFFWSIFDREEEFISATRNAAIFMGKPIGYPIENHLYELDPKIIRKVILELLDLSKSEKLLPANFAEFLQYRFGKTLYELYFKPYNEKIWRRDLNDVALSWLAGKLPMPTVDEILFNNIHQEKETGMVHSTFYYPKINGSQFLIDKMMVGLNIQCGKEVTEIRHEKKTNTWWVNGESFDYIVYAGNIKALPATVSGSLKFDHFETEIAALDYHGTTTALCQIDDNPYSWIYLPDASLSAHRIINTGNFSHTNNQLGVKTATVEFTENVDIDEILRNLEKLPYNTRYIDHQYTNFTYPIQDHTTRPFIQKIKQYTEPEGFFLLGRFAEWEYYNMDAAIGAAIDLGKRMLNSI
jgi:protoporphyrinogen oxidase